VKSSREVDLPNPKRGRWFRAALAGMNDEGRRPRPTHSRSSCEGPTRKIRRRGDRWNIGANRQRDPHTRHSPLGSSGALQVRLSPTRWFQIKSEVASLASGTRFSCFRSVDIIPRPPEPSSGRTTAVPDPTMPKTRLPVAELQRRALLEVKKQPGCHNMQEVAINRVTDARAETNWSLCVLAAGAADANTAARAAVHVRSILRRDYDLLAD
jgi:hypothetical protein